MSTGERSKAIQEMGGTCYVQPYSSQRYTGQRINVKVRVRGVCVSQKCQENMQSNRVNIL